jgi:Sulfotransferase domain
VVVGQTGRMREVHLHVGPVKTGSTFLQGLLWRYRDDLARQGYYHPATYENEMWLATNDVQNTAFVNYDMPQAKGVWAEVCQRVLAHDGPSVISHEVLGLSTEEHVDRIVDSLAPARLQVIVMARSLTAMLPSLWQESVKGVGSEGVSWPDFVALQRGSRAQITDSLLIVQRWLAHIPSDHIHVVTVPPARRDPSVLLRRFSDALGIDTTSWSTHDAARNVSIDMVQTELIRRLNQTSAALRDHRGQRLLVHDAILPSLRPPNSAWRIRLPSSERQWIESETYRRVDGLRECGARLHGDLDDLADSPHVWQDLPVKVLEADLLDEALHLLVASHPDTSDPDRLDWI